MLRRPARSKTADSSPLNGSGEYQSAFDLCFVEARWLFFKALEKKKPGFSGQFHKEAKLLAPGFIVDFVGTVSDQSTDGGVNVTTVTRLKVLVVDGARVAPTPKPKKRKKGAEDGDDDDDDDEPAAAAKKARAEGDETDDG